MPSGLLSLNIKDGTTPQLRRSINGQSTPIGGTFGSLEAGVDTSDVFLNRVIRTEGTQTMFALIRDTIYKTVNGGASWTVAYTNSDLGTTSSKTGLYQTLVNGSPRLWCFTKRDASNLFFFHYSDDGGTTWNKTAGVASSSSVFTFWSVAEWRGLYFAIYGGPGSILYYILDPANLTFSGGSFSDGNNAVLCVFNDRMFALGQPSTGAETTRVLYEYYGGSWHTIETTTTQGATGVDGRWTLFVDQASGTMIGIFPNVTSGAWRVYQWDSALTRTEITSTVGATILGTAFNSARVMSFVDPQDPSAGGGPTVYLFGAPNGTAGVSWTVYKWNGVASPITSVGSGGNVQHSMPFGVWYGEYLWTPGQRHIKITGVAFEVGGVRISFKIFSDVSADSCLVSFYAANQTGEFARTPKLTLTDPSAGTITGGNTISGLDASDNGVTTFDVLWDAQTDGYTGGEFDKLVPSIRAA